MPLIGALVFLGIIAMGIQYLFSMGWYLFVKFHWSIYIPEVITFFIGLVALVGMIIFTSETDSMPNAIASLFGAAFATPFVVSSIIASGLVFATTMIIKQRETNHDEANQSK